MVINNAYNCNKCSYLKLENIKLLLLWIQLNMALNLIINSYKITLSIIDIPGVFRTWCVGPNRTAVCPKGLLFRPVIFFNESSAVRGSLYAPGAGTIFFPAPNLRACDRNGGCSTSTPSWFSFFASGSKLPLMS